MDLKFALRALWKNPGFTLTAVLIMALGIGANTAMFSVVNAVLLRPLSYPEPDRIVTLSSLWKNSGKHGQVSAPDFHDWHDRSTAFSAMAFYDSESVAASVGSRAEYVNSTEVTPEFFQVFGVKPVVGRWFSADEQKRGGAALIGYAFWQSHFGGNPNVIGKNIRMFNYNLPIVGVLPAGFRFPDDSEVWLPVIGETPSRSAHNYLVVGKLKRGVSLESAQSQMTAIGARLSQEYPHSNEGKSVSVTRLSDEMVSNLRSTLYVLLGAVTLVLLIACANIATLLLAKATARSREIAIRAAVGASRRRIVKQLIVESLVLGVAGAFGGALLAVWGSAALVAMAPANVPRLEEAGIDGRVLAFTLAISLVASLLFGLVPALQASSVDLNDALKQASGRAVSGGRAGKMRRALVVAEIALAVILLAGAGLLLKSFVALHNVALGFHPDHLLVMQTSVPSDGLANARRAMGFYKDVLERVATLPGVKGAGATRALPGHVPSNGSYFIDRLPAEFNVSAPNAVLSVVTPGAFGALQIPVERGRDFNDSDSYDAPFTAVINEELARQSFAGQDPIGRTIFCGLDSNKPMRIVGVVGNIRQYGPAQPPAAEIYMPYQQHPQPSTSLSVIVRTAGEPTLLARTLRRIAHELSPETPVKFTTMEASLSEDIAAPRFRALLLGIFAGLAVCLAMAGIYGVMAYVVGQRLNEIGLRMALGASSADVLRLVLRQAAALAGIGLAIGLAGAFAATRLLGSVLFDVKPNDPVTYAAVAALLAVVVLSASYLPARRAAHVDPLDALRQE